MKDKALVLVDNSVLTETERTEINLHIDGIIEKYRQDSAELSRMALESASLITSVEARSGGMMRQGFFSRLWNSFTGKNHKLTASNQRDIAKAQYLSQQMLNKLFEQNLVQFEMMVAIEFKLNSLARDIFATNQKLLKVCNIMSGFLGKFREMQTDMDEFRRNNALLIWKGGIAYETVFGGKIYSQLKKEQKLVCLANDFHKKTNGKWSQEYMPFLKSVMSDVGLMPDEPVIPADILKAMAEDSMLTQRFFSKVGYSIEDLSPEIADIPFSACLAKLEKLKNDENYLIETVHKFAPDAYLPDVQSQIALEYIKGLTDRDLEKTLSCFDMVMELVSDLSMGTFFVLPVKTVVEEIEMAEPENVQISGDDVVSDKTIEPNRLQDNPWWSRTCYIDAEKITGDSISQIFISPSGKILCSATYGEAPQLWDIATAKHIKTIEIEHAGEPLYVITPDDKILFGIKNNAICIWNIETGKQQMKTFKGNDQQNKYDSIEALCLTPDGKRLFCSYYSPYSPKKYSIQVWDTETYNYIGTMGEHDGAGGGLLCISPDGETLVSGNRDGIKVWKTETREQIAHIEYDQLVNAICISPNGKNLFILCNNNIGIWDMDNFEQIGSIEENYYSNNFCITPDGKTLLVGHEENIDIVDIEARKVLNIIPSAGEMFCITPDGRTIISADDNSIRFW